MDTISFDEEAPIYLVDVDGISDNFELGKFFESLKHNDHVEYLVLFKVGSPNTLRRIESLYLQ